MSVTAIAQTQTRQRMRVLIVSLFSKQLVMLRREFPDLDIHATINHSRNVAKGSSVGMNIDADRILVMTRFVGHAATNGLDRTKVEYVNGAFSELRKRLRTLEIYSRANAPAPLKAVRIETPPDAVVDYSAFRTCAPGDVLEFIRPEGIPAHVFAQNVNEAMRFYETNGGVSSTCEIKGGKARVSILARVRPMLEAAEAALGEPSEFALAFEDQCAIETLWREVYLLSLQLSPFATDAHHATVASVAADGWLEMFKTKGN